MDRNDHELEDYGIFLLSEDIEDKSVDGAIRFILEGNLRGEHDHLTLIVNSPGGSVSSGFALIDMMEGSAIPVHTVGLGTIASMGLSIFIAGAKGHRTLTPNTMIMSHQWSGDRWGKEHELIAFQKRDNIVSNRIVRHYARHTGLSEERVRKVLMPPSDVYLLASEARKYGICDVIREYNSCQTGRRVSGRK